MLRPEIAVIADDLLDAHERTAVERRIQTWINQRIERVFRDLFRMQSDELKGAARGLGFQLLEGLGSLRRGDASQQIDALNKADRKQLRDLGVRIGRDMAYMPALLKPEAVYWRALLWSLHRGYRDIPDLPAPGRVSVPINKRDDLDFLEACGYRPLGPLAVRIDMAERLTSKAWLTAKKGPFAPTPDLLSLIGATLDDFPGVMRAIGFKRIQKKKDDGTPEDRYRPMRAKERAHAPQQRRKRPAKPAPAPDPHSPFAKLKDLSLGG